MLSWLKKANPSLQPPTLPGLLNPVDTDQENPVEKVVNEANSRKRKRGSYGTYDPETRANIAKLCIEICPHTAAKVSKEVGKQLNESAAWANSFLNRMTFVQRKGTKATWKQPVDFEVSKDGFHTRIQDAVREHVIPDNLILNWDQTGLPIVPVDTKGGWQRDQKGLAIFHVYSTRHTESVNTKLREANVIPVFLPASCTGELQPLDADGGINATLKEDLRQSFMTWYADREGHSHFRQSCGHLQTQLKMVEVTEDKWSSWLVILGTMLNAAGGEYRPKNDKFPTIL
ncbi:hypothetical protein Bbelb_125300 [Branchiostoma belcheri]|nr:hypothetical protein Bbelb_125300 [Branchiostoma belcheri]